MLQDQWWTVDKELDDLSDTGVAQLVIANWDTCVNGGEPFSTWLLEHLDVERQVPIYVHLVRDKGR